MTAAVGDYGGRVKDVESNLSKTFDSHEVSANPCCGLLLTCFRPARGSV